MAEVRNKKFARVFLTKHVTKMNEALSTQGTTLEEYEEFIIEFDRLSKDLNLAHSEFLKTIEEDEIEDIITEFDEFLTPKQKVKCLCLTKIKQMKSQRAPPNLNGGQGDNVNAQQGEFDAKLPKLELLKFNGEILIWKPFKESYVTHVHDRPGLSATAKMSHLLKLLEGGLWKWSKDFL